MKVRLFSIPGIATDQAAVIVLEFPAASIGHFLSSIGGLCQYLQFESREFGKLRSDASRASRCCHPSIDKEANFMPHEMETAFSYYAS
jgi:hypothetical protein